MTIPRRTSSILSTLNDPLLLLESPRSCRCLTVLTIRSASCCNKFNAVPMSMGSTPSAPAIISIICGRTIGQPMRMAARTFSAARDVPGLWLL